MTEQEKIDTIAANQPPEDIAKSEYGAKLWVKTLDFILTKYGFDFVNLPTVARYVRASMLVERHMMEVNEMDSALVRDASNNKRMVSNPINLVIKTYSEIQRKAAEELGLTIAGSRRLATAAKNAGLSTKGGSKLEENRVNQFLAGKL